MVTEAKFVQLNISCLVEAAVQGCVSQQSLGCRASKISIQNILG